MPSLLWQLHHSEDGSGSFSGAAQMPPTSSSTPRMKKTPPEDSENHPPGTDSIISRKEDLPGLQSALRGFKSAHPSFESTSRVDETRDSEFPHLADRACFDYCGFGLFTQTQRFIVGASRSGFSLAPASLSDPLLEPLHSQLRQRVLAYLNISEDSYTIIFTASKRAAFNLVAGCYDFRSRPRLVSCYDHRSESLQCIIDSAKKSGARISAAKFKWPELEICGEELAGELRRSSSRSRGSRSKGLFVFPTQSRITGIKYSYQWMTMAEKHHWDLLLDVSAMGPRDMGSFGLSIFRPDFIVCSFYKVFGADPSGFGCLLIKSSSLRALSLGSAEGIGSMVKAVPDPEADLRELEEEENESRDDQGSEEPVIAFSGPVLDLPSLLVSDAEAAEFREADFSSDDEEEDESFAGSSSRGGDSMNIQGGSSNGECEIQEEKLQYDPGSSLASSSSHLNGGYHPDSGDDSILRRIGRDEGLIDSRQSDILRKILPIKEDEEYDPDEIYEINNNDPGAASSSRPTNSYYYDENQSANDEESWDYEDEDSEDDDQRDEIRQRESQQLIICRGLDHANSMGLNRSNCRIKSLMDWLITSLSSLYHQVLRENSSGGLNPSSEAKRFKRRPLVRIFGPKTSIDRGPAVAFNLYDQRGALIQPSLVQKLADRNSISLGCGCLSNLFLDEAGGSSGDDKENSAATPGSGAGSKPGSSGKHHHRKKLLPEKCSSFGGVGGSSSGSRGGMKRLSNLWVVTATLGLMSSFEDVYRLWSFVAEFLDPQFLAAEVLQYQSLNQETVVIGGDEIHQQK